MSEPSDLRQNVLAFIQADPKSAPAELSFERLALQLFEYQFAENEPYRRFCERRRLTPGTVSDWTGIPAVPTAAFKETALTCGAAEGAEVVFRTSGTSQGLERRGAHYVRDLTFYRASALTHFQRCVLSDRVRLPMLVLHPPFDALKDSSLSWMLDRVCEEYGGPGSEHFVGESGLLTDLLLVRLMECESQQRPVVLLGTATAFAHLLDELAAQDRCLRLAPGSRVMETGGFKGASRSISRDEFYASLTQRLGISPFYCVAEYGMTEMCSQFYDNVLRERARGRSPVMRHKLAPAWVRTFVVDADTLQPVAPGRVGVLRHFDLANVDSVMAIQTDDLGVACEGGFEIFGRASGSELRGCSIAIDQWLTAQR